MKLVFLVLVFLNPLFLHAQECDCKSLSKLIIKKLESNYVISSELKYNKMFQKYKRFLFTKNKVIEEQFCGAFIYLMLETLNDKHVTFTYNYSSNTNFKPLTFLSNYEDKMLIGTADPIEGMWVPESSGIKMVAIKDSANKQKYYFVITESQTPKWRKGDIRAIMYQYNKIWFVDYYRSNYNKFTTKLFYENGVLNFGNNFNLYRESKREQINTHAIVGNGLFYSDSSTYSYIKLQDFVSTPYICDSLLNKFGKIISSTPHLVIDIRNNGGGSARNYQSILPYLYTNPVRIESAKYNASKENIEKMESIAARYPDTNSLSFKSFKRLIALLKLNEGYNVLDSGSYQIRDSIYLLPKKVSILINNKVLSAAELFVLNAIQSKKVTVFGSKTGGAADKLDAMYFDLGCDMASLSIPISIRIREKYKKAIDGYGISPNVYVDEKRFDLIKFVLDYQK